LREGLAASAGQAWPHDPLHREVAGDVLQLFRHILAELLDRPAAVAAGLAGRQHLVFTIKM